ncbi:Sorbitol dehydrogenase OS=Lysinibacillus sphaericus OX=1421 GN=gutB_1 PE=3 SV=1 [Lysinibacillus sphaericus]
MKAARWYKARDIRVENIEEPSIASGKVKIKVHWTGICGSDLHEYAAGRQSLFQLNSHTLSVKISYPLLSATSFLARELKLGKVRRADSFQVLPPLR